MSEATGKTYTQRLMGTISGGFRKVTPDDTGFILHGSHASVQVTATEADIASHVQGLAEDGLRALGPVHDDATGLEAGLGLLAVHIEELAGSDSSVTHIEITPTEVRPIRDV